MQQPRSITSRKDRASRRLRIPASLVVTVVGSTASSFVAVVGSDVPDQEAHAPVDARVEQADRGAAPALDARTDVPADARRDGGVGEFADAAIDAALGAPPDAAIDARPDAPPPDAPPPEPIDARPDTPIV